MLTGRVRRLGRRPRPALARFPRYHSAGSDAPVLCKPEVRREPFVSGALLCAFCGRRRAPHSPVPPTAPCPQAAPLGVFKEPVRGFLSVEGQRGWRRVLGLFWRPQAPHRALVWQQKHWSAVRSPLLKHSPLTGASALRT